MARRALSLLLRHQRSLGLLGGHVGFALGERFGLSANIVRLIFALSILIPGPQVIFYIILWVLIPKEA